MAVSLTPDSPLPMHVHDFFLARQPILDRSQEPIAYELLFRHANCGSARITSDLTATATVIAHASHLGLERVVGQLQGYVNVDAAVLMSDMFRFLPKDRIVLEIIETTKVTPEVLERVAQLHRDGFVFALDDVIADTHDVQQLLPYVDIIKCDLRAMPPEALAGLSMQFKRANKKLLAEKVESQEQFAQCLDLGFDYFQGYYFAKPHILSGKKLAPSQITIVKLMSLLASNADNDAVEQAIKQEVSIGINLLRLVNTPAFGMVRSRITSLKQALLLLGRTQLQRWLQIMLYTEPLLQGEKLAPLMSLAMTRGRLLELAAEHLHPGRRDIADTAFTVGILSLVDALFGVTMEQMLVDIPVSEPVALALLRREGFHGSLLKLAEALEQIEHDSDTILPLLDALKLSSDTLYQIELAAYEWSDQMARSSQPPAAAS